VAAVALESTVISHGLPYPLNLRLALRLEEIAASHGARPATVGVIAGEIVVGLRRAQIGRVRLPMRSAGRLAGHNNAHAPTYAR
jgi:pseudouridine-5'-phosphate glycosidase